MSAPIKLCDQVKSRAILGGENSPISRSTFYEGIAEGRFPKPVRIGPHAVRWVEDELEQCKRAMLEVRDQAPPKKTRRRR
ncbi:putative DNA-binding transcriptional regulator AlpA [Bradyrhizobium sp. AZCC 1578]|uniref:helix-turn-helix transcriptional regulator n=1 Tax=Bradyrhizobium sp. AZCC 1578 TaxID=3117027 RepID=UPI002FF2413F